METKEWKSLDLWRSVIAECLATFFYVFLACTVTLNWTPNIYRAVLDTSDLLQIALAFGLALSTLTQSFSHISGAHINPAVTIATLVTCQVTPLRGVLYVIAQCGGGIAGAALLYGIVPEEHRGNLGATLIHPDLFPSQGCGIEFLMTFVLTFTFFATVDSKRRHQGNEAIPLGLTMTLVHIVGYRLTGSSCNPARSLGPAFVRNTWANHWIYWCGPIAGSIVAALLYQFVFAQNRGCKSKACSLAGLQETNNGQEETVFSIYGNSKTKKKQSAPDPNPASHSQMIRDYSCDVTTAFFKAETSRKLMTHTLSEPRAPPGSVETGLDVVIPVSLSNQDLAISGSCAMSGFPQSACSIDTSDSELLMQSHSLGPCLKHNIV